MPISDRVFNRFKKKKKSGLTAPKVADKDTQRALEKIYEDLNKLKDATNKSSGTDSEEHEGKPGDIRIIKTSNKTYNLEVKGEDGWVTGIISGNPIEYKSIGSRKKYEPSEITVNEEGQTVVEEPPPPITSDNIADFTSNFLTRSDLEADFDTGWFDMNNNDAALRERNFDISELQLESIPRHWEGWIKTSSAPAVGTNDGTNIYPWRKFQHDSAWSGIDWRFNGQLTELQFATNSANYTFWQMHQMSHTWYNLVECRFRIWK